MIKFLIICLSLLLTKPIFADFIPADDPNFQYIGRVDFTNKKAPLISWAGPCIKANITGTSLKIKIDGKGSQHMFGVIINGNYDDVKVFKCTEGEGVYEIASGLENKTHEVTVHKRTDGGKNEIAFIGFELDDGAALKTPPPRATLRMEVYGDSISTGLGGDRKRGKEHSREATDNVFSYGARTARNLNAEFHCISKSGIGLTKSWWPTIMPQYYNRLSACSLEGKGKEWEFSKWQPHLVCINLFQNDSWTVKKPNNQKVISDYVSFVKKIREHYPKAKIVCLLGSMSASKSKWAGFIKEAVKQLNDDGDKEVYSYIFKLQTGHRHPNNGEQAKMAAELTKFISTLDLKPDTTESLKKTEIKTYPPATDEEIKMHAFLIRAYKKYKSGQMSKIKFVEGANKIASSLPGTKTADIAMKLIKQ